MNTVSVSAENSGQVQPTPEVMAGISYDVLPEVLVNDPEFQREAVNAEYHTRESLFMPREIGVDEQGNTRYMTIFRNMKQTLTSGQQSHGGSVTNSEDGRLKLVRIRLDEVEPVLPKITEKDPELAEVLQRGGEVFLVITLRDATTKLSSLRSEVDVYEDALNGTYRQAVLSTRPRAIKPPLYDLI